MTADRVNYLPALDRAYQLALRVTGSAHLAEEAVQEACLKMARLTPGRIEAIRSPETFFLRMVHDAAADLLRSERAMKAREGRVSMDANHEERRVEGLAADRELALAARAELAGLSPEMRVAVCLCCEQGLTHRETAEILDVPVDTVSTRVRRGLEALRERLAARGFASLAAPALGAALGGLGVPAAPAALQAAAAKIGLGAMLKSSGGAAAGAVLKGGLLVKIGLGVAAAGLIAGTIGLIGHIGPIGPMNAPPPAAEKVPGKDYPYGEGVVYRREWFLGSRVHSMDAQDGPALEIESPISNGGVTFSNGDRYIADAYLGRTIRKYDAKKKRVSTIAWAGPWGKRGRGTFETARYGSTGYNRNWGFAGSPDEKALFIYDDANKNAVWRLDLETLTVRPVEAAAAVQGAVHRVQAPDGSLYFVHGDGKLKKLLPDGKTVKDMGVTLQQPVWVSDFCNMIVNEKLGRLYAMKRGPCAFGVIWYWDMKTGQGVRVAGPTDVEQVSKEYKARLLPKNATGPADKFVFWCPWGLSVGPDNGDRYLYAGGGDDFTIYRIDTEKNYVHSLVPADPKDRSLWTFGDTAKGVNCGTPWPGAPEWGREGEFYLGHGGTCVEVFRPVEVKK